MTTHPLQVTEERPLLASGDAYGGRFSDPAGDEVEREVASHEAYEAVEKLYRLFEPQTAHWLATTAIISADAKYRKGLLR